MKKNEKSLSKFILYARTVGVQKCYNEDILWLKKLKM